MNAKVIHTCIDMTLEGQAAIEAEKLAIRENPANLSAGFDIGAGGISPLELALEKRALWKPGRTLKIRFLGGVPPVRQKVEEIALQWTQFANLNFDFGDHPDAEIRIAFIPGMGSWSYVGTDCLAAPEDQPTMNLGWLTSETRDEEYSRVVLHEFGHALGCIHEHQHPAGGIPWNVAAVLRYYTTPPHNWTPDRVELNLFKRYDSNQTQFSAFDPQSIMLYPVPNDLTEGDFEVGWNRELSETDKNYIGQVYAKASA